MVVEHPSNMVLQNLCSKSQAGFSEGKMKTNQDATYCAVSLKSAPNCALFGVFDGHGLQGHKVSAFVKQHLKSSFEKRFDPNKPYSLTDYKEILEATCVELNEMLTAEPSVNSTMSGSTGILVLLHNDQILCANIGDSRAGVIKLAGAEDPGELIMLSRDHTPKELDELERIIFTIQHQMSELN